MSLVSAVAEELYTVEEYLAFERTDDERHEYVDGRIVAMSSVSSTHAEICANLGGLIASQLRGTPCRARLVRTKVRSAPTPLSPDDCKGMFSYPDCLVICGELEYHDADQDVVTNPKVILEVLPPKTEGFDRDVKFQRYDHWNPTLVDYLLIAQHWPKVEHYTRQSDGSWKYRHYSGLETSAVIESINCQLPLADLYHRVEFPPPNLERIVFLKKLRTTSRKKKQ